MRRRSFKSRRRSRRIASRARKSGAIARNTIFHRRGGIRL